MNIKPGWKEYAVSALLTAAVITCFFMIKLFVFHAPDDGFVMLEINGRSFIPAIAVGIAASAVFLLIKKPDILFTVAVTSVLCSFMCAGDMFSALYVFASLCLLGSIPFVASLLARVGHAVSEDGA